MRQNTMKTLSNLIAALLILSATFLVAGWMQGDGKASEYKLQSQEYVITAPSYVDPTIRDLNSGYGNKVTVQVIFHEDIIDLNVKYIELGGDATLVAAFSSSGTSPDGERKCYVHVIMPEDWNDKQQLQSLGHEIMHCFGANHIGEIL